MRTRPISYLLFLVLFLVAPATRADEPSGWEIGTPTPPPPPPPPPAPQRDVPTTFVVEESNLGKPTTRMASPVMFGIGAAFAGLGLISFGAGYAVTQDAPDCTDCPGSEKRTLGTGMMTGGIIGVVLGVPLAFVGARQVPDTPAWARVMPAVFVSPRAAVFRWTF